MGVNFRFDWTNNRFEMNGGTPVEITGEESCEAWAEQMLHIKRGRLPIYPNEYGTSVHELIGKRLPSGYIDAEVEREIKEAVALCPGIKSVSDIKINNGDITMKLQFD